MTHDELLAKISEPQNWYQQFKVRHALRAVVELHKSNQVQEAVWCNECSKRFKNSGWYEVYPCPTIQVIEKELK